MFNIGGGELLIILLVALVVLGPTKLPEAARQVGKMVGEFKKVSSSFQTEVREAMKDPVNTAVKKADIPNPLEPFASVPAKETPPDVTAVATPPILEKGDTELLKTAQADSTETASTNGAAPDSASTDTASNNETTPTAEEPVAADDSEKEELVVDPPMFGDR